ncbi:PPPDE putative peptidase domain-containing protein [Syncephalis plumigaleata]|nr:PPPDE putative peptidase domain-containing protein [Syncephalis plumigaleata]
MMTPSLLLYLRSTRSLFCYFYHFSYIVYNYSAIMAEYEGHPVKLYVYDLSRGMAQAMSLALTGRQIDGIWHTSVVVYGQEYYFGQGIQTDRPGTTVHGNPQQIIDMGVTFLPQEVFVEFLENIRERFSADKYHLLDHNCNTFTNEVVRFLVDKTIPDFISNLPADFLQTPFGQQMRPMIESFFGPSQLGVRATTTTEVASSTTAPATTIASTTKQLLYEARNLAALTNLLSANRAVVVYFTSQGCPPCRVIAPEFQRLITDPEDFDGKIAKKPIIGVTVDTGVAYDAAMKYQIRGTPTFMFFLDGEKNYEFSGANLSELKSNINLLRFTAYPPHPHEKLNLAAVNRFLASPIRFSALPKIATAFGKLREFIDAYETLGGRKLLTNTHRKYFDSLEQWFTRWEQAHLKGESFTEELPDGWYIVIDHLLINLPTDKAFPVLDFIRVILLNKTGRAHYASDKDLTLLAALHAATTHNASNEPAPRPYILLCLRSACHLFIDPVTSDWAFSTAKYNLPPVGYDTKEITSPHTVITELMVQSLLAEDVATRRAAASLAFNVGTRIWELRTGTEQSEGGTISNTAETNVQNDDAWLVECASAMVEALRNEQDEEIIYRLALALARLTLLGPPSLSQLLQVLELPALAQSKSKEVVKREEVRQMLNDLSLLSETENA